MESLNGFIEDHIYEVVKEESMDLVALENIYVEEQHVVYTCDYSKTYRSISNEELEKRCSGVRYDATNKISISTIIFTYRVSL